MSTAGASRRGAVARGVEAVLAAALLAAAGLGLYSVNRPLPNADALLTDSVPAGAVVVDARGSLAYRQGHLPGARSVWSRSLLSFDGAVPGMLAAPEALAEELRAAGLTPNDRVVVYDDGDGRDAPLVLLVLRAFGLDARLLDGGLEGWRAAGGAPQSGGPGEVTPSDAPFTFDTQLVVSGDEAAEHLADDAIAPVDVRAAGAYGAEHLEGAIRLDAEALLPDGSLPRFSTLDAQLRQVRLTRDTHPLIYGADVRQAARAWLTLAAYGTEHLHVYRGPFEGLAQAGLPLSRTAAAQATSTRSSSVCWR
ncbi:MAG: rhodanese-like domain-containing protein [Trueperaceae bacterium]|nr:rhodanese-like domain-containing protein [Trueperaceae bacterium]